MRTPRTTRPNMAALFFFSLLQASWRGDVLTIDGFLPYFGIKPGQHHVGEQVEQDDHGGE